MPINPILAGLTPSLPAVRDLGALAPGGASFADRLDTAIRSVSDHQNAADVRIANVASGDDVDVHGMMIALQEADITLRLAVAVRDKLVDGFDRIQNMQI